MRKILIPLQLLFIFVLGAGILYSVLKPRPILKYNPELWNSWEGFSVISYTGITKKGEAGYVSRKQLEGHLHALKQAGYNTITPEDTEAFLENKASLPDKAVLILFEGGRKDSYLYATPLLQKFGMIATMCVPTGFIETWGSFYLHENDLEKLSKQAHWRLCSMGHEAAKEIVIDSAGSKGHFLTQRLWLGSTVEDDAAFQKRVTEDYVKAARSLERASGKPVVVYLYPFADPGTGANADPLALEMNQKAVAAHHKIAFTSSDDPFNGPYSKPLSLNRLRVDSSWDGQRLVQELHNFMPRQLPVVGLSDENVWFKRGNIQFSVNKVILSSNSSIWLRGSDNWFDLDVTAKAHLSENASVALFVRYDRYEGTDSFLRLTLNQNFMTLNERIGTVYQTLVRGPVVSSINNEYNFRLKVKGNRAWIWLNNKSIDSPVPVSPSIVRGRIGIICLSETVQLLDLHAEPLPKVYAFARSYRGLPPSIQQEISAVLPVLFSLDITPRIDDQQRIDLLLAASSGVKTIPIVEINKNVPTDAAENFINAILSALNHSSVKPLITHFAVYGMDNTLPEALRKRGYSLVRILSPEEVIHFVDQKQILNDDIILIKGPEREKQEAIKRLLHVVPSSRLIVQTDSKTSVPPEVSTAVNLVQITERGI